MNGFCFGKALSFVKRNKNGDQFSVNFNQRLNSVGVSCSSIRFNNRRKS